MRVEFAIGGGVSQIQESGEEAGGEKEDARREWRVSTEQGVTK